MKIKNLTLLAIVALVFAACDGKKTAEEIYAEQQSGVCLVENSYYYSVDFNDDMKLYFTGIDAEGNLENAAMDENEVREKRNTAYATAFFIDENGTMITSRHIVDPVIDRDSVAKATSRFISNVKDVLQNNQEEYAKLYQELEQSKTSCYHTDSYGSYVDDLQLKNIEESQAKLRTEFNESQKKLSDLEDIDEKDFTPACISEISIAYPDSPAGTPTPCSVVKLGDNDTDLALIQIDTKATPADRYVFKIQGRDQREKSLGEKISGIFGDDSDEQLASGMDLVMISCGELSTGALKSTGTVSSEPAGDMINYSITNTSTACGAPVVDVYGFVRAVNTTSDGAGSHGIPAEKILQLLQ